MSKIQLENYLRTLTKEQLIQEIGDLYSTFKGVRELYELRLNPNEGAILEAYKAQIRHQFFPKHGYGEPNLSVAKKAVSDFKKIRPAAHSVADMMLFYVEQGIKFTNAYGDIDENFYNSMETMYENALNFMDKNNLLDVFHRRCLQMVNETEHCGWGFHDQLAYFYRKYFRIS